METGFLMLDLALSRQDTEFGRRFVERWRERMQQRMAGRTGFSREEFLRWAQEAEYEASYETMERMR